MGAWQAIEECGLPVAGIVGTSIGALVGAYVVGRMGWHELVPLAFALRKQDIVRINRRAVLINRNSPGGPVFRRAATQVH